MVQRKNVGRRDARLDAVTVRPAAGGDFRGLPGAACRSRRPGVQRAAGPEDVGRRADPDVRRRVLDVDVRAARPRELVAAHRDVPVREPLDMYPVTLRAAAGPSVDVDHARPVLQRVVEKDRIAGRPVDGAARAFVELAVPLRGDGVVDQEADLRVRDGGPVAAQPAEAAGHVQAVGEAARIVAADDAAADQELRGGGDRPVIADRGVDEQAVALPPPGHDGGIVDVGAGDPVHPVAAADVAGIADIHAVDCNVVEVDLRRPFDMHAEAARERIRRSDAEVPDVDPARPATRVVLVDAQEVDVDRERVGSPGRGELRGRPQRRDRPRHRDDAPDVFAGRRVPDVGIVGEPSREPRRLRRPG